MADEESILIMVISTGIDMLRDYSMADSSCSFEGNFTCNDDPR